MKLPCAWVQKRGLARRPKGQRMTIAWGRGRAQSEVTLARWVSWGSRHPSKSLWQPLNVSLPPAPERRALARVSPGMLYSPLHHQGLRAGSSRGACRSALVRRRRSRPGDIPMLELPLGASRGDGVKFFVRGLFGSSHCGEDGQCFGAVLAHQLLVHQHPRWPHDLTLPQNPGW